ncbi:hypothetical protein FNQ90_04980, partial [Streptomyces alkaliphilus]|nr:hypothetical protein [Streptomyces alkaliphilus]
MSSTDRPGEVTAPAGRSFRRFRHALRLRSLGAEPGGARLERMRSSPHFRDGAFRNERPIDGLDVTDYLPLLRESLNREARARRHPARP